MLVCGVKRTTVFLPDDLHEQLRVEAFRTKTSMAELIRKRLQHSLPKRGKRTSIADPILKVAGSCQAPAFSEDIDKAVYGE
jgi:hypothetical protein